MAPVTPHHRFLAAVISRVAITCLVLCSSAAYSQTIHPDWSAEQVGFGIKPAFDFDSNGNIHVMGMTEAIPGVVWYDTASSVAGPWNPQTVENGYFYGPGDLRVDRQDDVAHIAFHHHDAQNAAHISIDGGVATTYIASHVGHDGWDNSLAFKSDGSLAMASVDPSGFGTPHSLDYAEFDGTAWTTTNIVESDSFMYGFNTSLAYDSNDNPHITYTAASNWTAVGDLKLAKRVNGTWDISTIATGGIRGRFATMAIDDSDRLHVGWLDVDANDFSIGTVEYGLFENGAWSYETIDTLTNIELGFNGGRKQVSLALDDQGEVHVAYGDKRVVKYATKESSGWDSITVAETASDFYNGLTVLRLNPIDQSPTVAYWSPDTSNAGIVWLASANTGEFCLDGCDGVFDCTDIDALVAEIASGNNNPDFDFTGDGLVDLADRDLWLAEAGAANNASGNPYLLGDANLDGVVDVSDLNIWSSNKFQSTAAWCSGDFNADGFVDVSDLNIWSSHKFQSSDSVSAVPEPEVAWPAMLVALLIGIRRQSAGRDKLD